MINILEVLKFDDHQCILMCNKVVLGHIEYIILDCFLLQDELIYLLDSRKELFKDARGDATILSWHIVSRIRSRHLTPHGMSFATSCLPPIAAINITNSHIRFQ